MKRIILRGIQLVLCFLFTNAAANEPLTIALDWFPYPVHALLFVGLDQGYFKEQGLSINLVSPADPSDPPKLVAANEADIAITYEPQFMEQVDMGLPLVRLATLVDKPLDCLAILDNRTIHSIAGLKGKKIAYSVNGLGNIALKTMLSKNGVALNEVELINVHFDLLQALLAKRVDAITGIMRNLEIIQLKLMGKDPIVFYPEKNGVPTYSELIFVINKNKVSDPKWIKFLIALQQSDDYFHQHPYKSWGQFAKKHPQFNTKLNSRAWIASVPYIASHPAEFNEADWLTFATFMQKNGLIHTVQPIDRYAINLLKGH